MNIMHSILNTFYIHFLRLFQISFFIFKKNHYFYNLLSISNNVSKVFHHVYTSRACGCRNLFLILLTKEPPTPPYTQSNTPLSPQQKYSVRIFPHQQEHFVLPHHLRSERCIYNYPTHSSHP